MNEMNAQLKAISLDYLAKLYDMLEIILQKFSDIFGSPIKYDNQNYAFVGSFKGYEVVVMRDHNNFYIKACVLAGKDNVAAEATIYADGQYSETYKRIDKDTKLVIMEWFDAIAGSAEAVVPAEYDSEEDVEETPKTSDDE